MKQNQQQGDDDFSSYLKAKEFLDKYPTNIFFQGKKTIVQSDAIWVARNEIEINKNEKRDAIQGLINAFRVIFTGKQLRYKMVHGQMPGLIEKEEPIENKPNAISDQWEMFSCENLENNRNAFLALAKLSKENPIAATLLWQVYAMGVTIKDCSRFFGLSISSCRNQMIKGRIRFVWYYEKIESLRREFDCEEPDFIQTCN